MFNSCNQDNKNETTDTAKDDPLIPRKEAAADIESTVGTMAFWDSTKRHDLKPVKISGRVYYYKSVLDKFKLRDMSP